MVTLSVLRSLASAGRVLVISGRPILWGFGGVTVMERNRAPLIHRLFSTLSHMMNWPLTSVAQN
jgi:hypothetical protein